jgi:hypothetical protein
MKYSWLAALVLLSSCSESEGNLNNKGYIISKTHRQEETAQAKEEAPLDR